MSHHNHDIFGGDVTPTSDRDSLLAGSTTCGVGTQPVKDRSGYWGPTVIVAGEELRPTPTTASPRM